MAHGVNKAQEPYLKTQLPPSRGPTVRARAGPGRAPEVEKPQVASPVSGSDFYFFYTKIIIFHLLPQLPIPTHPNHAIPNPSRHGPRWRPGVPPERGHLRRAGRRPVLRRGRRFRRALQRRQRRRRLPPQLPPAAPARPAPAAE